MIYWLTCAAGDEAPSPDFLHPSEQEKFAGLRFAKRRREWLLGRWTAKHLLQLALPAYSSFSLGDVVVGNDPGGAPYLSIDREGRLPVSLSISHRRERALCALTPSPLFSVGTDLEYVEPRARAFVEDFFTAHEAQRVWACPSALRDALVTVIWSAKEAVLKAVRQGLRVDTRTVDIHHVSGIEDGPCTPICALSKIWYNLQVSSTLPGTAHLAAWWRPWGNEVMTMTVLARSAAHLERIPPPTQVFMHR